MPQVELWLGNDKKVIDVNEPVPEYLYMYPEPELMTYCGDPGPPQNTTIKRLRYKVVEWRNHKTGERGYKGVLVD